MVIDSDGAMPLLCRISGDKTLALLRVARCQAVLVLWNFETRLASGVEA